MGTIPTQRDRAAVTTAAAFDPFPGRAVRAEAQRELGRAQSIISLTGTAVNVAGQLGQKFLDSKKRSAQAKFNAGLEQVSSELKAAHPDDPEAFQEQFRAHIADLTDGQPFLGKEAQFVAEAKMARDLGTILQRQIAVQKQEDLAGLNSQERIFTSQAQDLNPVVSATKIEEFRNLVDAAVEDRVITAQDGDKRKHNIQFNAERGIVKLLPPATALKGLQDGTFLKSGTPEQVVVMAEQVRAKLYQDLRLATTLQNAELKASKAERTADNEAAVDRIEVARRNNTFTLADLDKEAKFLTGAEQRTYLTDLQAPTSTTDTAGSIVSIEGPLSIGDPNGAQHALANAITDGGVSTDSIKYYNKQIRLMRNKIQNESRKRIHDQFQLVAGAMRGMGPVMQDIQRNALSQFAEFVEANPFATQSDLLIEEKAIIDRFNILALDRITETIGLPRTLASDVTRDNMTDSHLTAAYRTLKFMRSEEAVTEESFLNQGEIIDTWKAFLEKKLEKSKDTGQAGGGS